MNTCLLANSLEKLNEHLKTSEGTAELKDAKHLLFCEQLEKS